MSHVVLQDLYQNANFEDDAIARYMNKKVFVLHQESLRWRSQENIR